MLRCLRILPILMMCLALSVQAQELPQRQLSLSGQAGLKFMFWDIYDASLYTADGSYRFFETLPFALELTYKRAISKEQFMRETRRQWQSIGGVGPAQLQAWLAALEEVLVDVVTGDSITLHVDQFAHSYFYYNQTLVGSIEDPEFSERFAAIWLSEATTRPGFRQALLGGS
jgi:hypothetical protein